VQFDPIKLTMKAPGTKRLKLECDDLLSNFALNFNLRRYSSVRCETNVGNGVCSRGLHSFSFQLNLSSSVNRIPQIDPWMCPAFAQVEL
jgi:hypothetical protein